MAEQNSIESYCQLMDTEYLGEKQKLVLDYIKKHPNCTYNDISRALKLHHNTCTARIRELRMYGLIVKSGDRVDESTKKKNSTYRIRSPAEPEDPIKDNTLMPLPKAVYDCLKNYLARRFDTTTDARHIDEFIVRKIGSTVSLEKNDDSFRFNYIREIWEDTARETVGIIGNFYNVKFRLK